MGYISYEDFVKMQSQKQSTGNYSQNKEQRKNRVGFFKLANDGDEAVVRFAYTDPSEFKVYTVHPMTVEGKFRTINCLRDLQGSLDDCPLCSAGVQLQQKFFIKLIEYVRNEDGSITPTPKIWSRPASYIKTLNNLFTEYGNISDCVFKIKRSGAAGFQKTEYSIMFGNPTVYNENLYPKDFSAFDNYDVLGNCVLDKTKAELEVLARESTGFTNVGTQTPTPAPVQRPVEPATPDITLNYATPRKVQY